MSLADRHRAALAVDLMKCAVYPRLMHDRVLFTRADQQVLRRLRPICLAFPETHEVEQFGTPWFKAGRRPFVVFAGQPGEPSIGFATPKEDQAALCAMDPQRFFPTPYMHPHGWTSMRVEDPVPWDLVEQLAETGYRRVALKRMLRALDAA